MLMIKFISVDDDDDVDDGDDDANSFCKKNKSAKQLSILAGIRAYYSDVIM